MIKFETNIDINRPVRQVFDFVADLKNAGKWSSMSTTTISDGPIGVGTTFTMVSRSEGKSNWQVIAFEQDKRLGLKGSGRGMDLTAEMTFESSSTGTRLHYTFTVQPKGLMKLLEPFIAGAVKKEEAGELKKLKTLLEA